MKTGSIADNMDDIAVIGIGCKFPGANNIEEYWRVLANSENHIVDIPKERWNNEAFYSENKDEPGKSYVNKAGFINGYDEWDNKLFGISDSEAVHIDPQQRQVLECTHMALEDAGITRKCLKGTETGVYLGVMNDDYKSLSSFDHDEDTNYSATGMSTTIISARISYVYDLRGPCMVVDTACSSSMVAIHLGCQSLRSGDCDMAICGGVSSILIPDQFITLCKARMLSPSGQCQSFSDAADGYGRGEGCGIVILKSVTQAIRDNNKIWGIVKTGCNQDGRVTQPITAPSGQQQEELLKKLYFQYGIDPNNIQYIEAHGTGTSIGDPTEINAIGRFIESYRTKLPNDKENVPIHRRDTDQNLHTLQHTFETEHSKSENDSTKKEHILIGSVKSNIGHLESAAGVAALIKVLLMMNHGKFVPSLHIKKDKSNINKNIHLEKYGLDVSLEFADWKQNKKGERICCVNCFGFGGSNTHAIVVQRGLPASPAQTTIDNKTNNQYQIVVLSGITKAALVSNIEAVEKDLATGHYEVKDLSFTSIYKRDHFSYRTFVFGTNKEDIKKQLRQKLVNADKIETEKKTRIIFVFCGVGTTWTGMCQEMMNTHNVFRKAIDEIDTILQPLTGWSIAKKFQEETDYSEPFLNHISLFCAQVALFELWKSLGIRPDGIVGQSVGEVAASYASGSLSLPDAVNVIYHRSHILSEMKRGKMMVAGNFEVSKLESLCKKMNNRVTIAVYNSPVSCTVSGDADAIEQLKGELEDINKKKNLDIMIRPLSVHCAYHSSHMEPCVEQIKSKLSVLKKKRNRTTDQFSTVTGELAENDEFQTATYWADNIRKPVLFSNAITRSADDQAHNVFIEIGPRPVLRAHLNHIMGSQLKGVSLPSMSPRKETESIYTSLSTLFELGVDISWENFAPADGNIISVPRYIFQKTKLLHIPKGKQPLLKGSNVQQSNSHLYVKRNHEGKSPFLILLDKNATMFVYDHYLYNAVLVPGATYVEAAFEIGHQMSSLNVYEISVSVEFENTHMPGKDQMCLIALDVEEKGTNEFEFHVRIDGKILSKGRIFPRKKFDRKEFDIRAIIKRCKTHRTKMKSYECLQNLNFRYGESLSVIEQSWASSTECVVEFVMPDSVLRHRKLTHVHPSIVDGMFQTFGILGSNGAADGPTLPKGLGSMILNRPPERHMFGYSRLVKSSPNGNHYNSFLLSPDGHVTAEILDFFTKSMVDVSDTAKNMIYSAVWREAKLSSKIEQDETQMKEIKVTIISSERFLTYYNNLQNSHEQLIEYIDIENDFTEEALGCLSGSHAVVYAPFLHIDNMNSDGTVMFECVKRSFLQLSQIIHSLRDQKKEFPVFIVTENTMGYISKEDNSSNVCGAELWGMVRSMISEEAYQSLTLVDMTTSEENGAVLKKILKTVTYGYNEFMIENGKCYIPKIEEVSELGIPFRREIKADITEDVILLSSLSTELKDMYFDIRSRENIRSDIPNECKLHLQTFCLHSSLIFPISQEMDCEENISLKESPGYPLICIEGFGQKQETFASCSEGNSQTVFCYPINVSAAVSVPEKCTFDVTTLPTYIPGMMTVGILLWNVVEVCKMSSNICVVVENRSEDWIHILTHFLSDLSKSVQIQTKSVFDECTSSGKPSIRTLVVLAELTNTQLDEIVKVYPSLEEIVSLDEFFPKSRQIFIKMKKERIVLTSLKTEEMFMSNELTKTVPKVYNKLKSMENKIVYSCQPQTVLDHGKLGKADILNLPYPVFSLFDDSRKPKFPLLVTQNNVFRINSCYILVGGLTGLGWELLQFMAELGVKHIAVLSRSLPTKIKENEMEQVRKKYGCRVMHIQADISNLSQLTRAFDTLKGALGNNVDIRGIFHGGGVTRDKLLKNMSSNDLEVVLLPKVLGTWNLHIATAGMQLDFFTMHSSIVSIFGNQGQCNYAAGNSFQDSFAKYRRSQGLSGQSINWSTLSLGMATKNKELEKYLNSQGFIFLTKAEIRQCFIQAVMSNRIQIMFGRFDWHKMIENPVFKKNPVKFSEILTHIPTTADKSKQAVKGFDIFELSRDPEKQKQMINEVVKANIAEAFVVDESKLTETTKIVTLGIDSMAAMSFINVMNDMTKVRIPIGTVFNESTTVEDLSTFIATRIQNGLESADTTFETLNDRAQKYFTGNITFMQRTLLDDFVKTPFSRNTMRQVDFEISGVTLRKNDMKIVFNHLIKTNPDLRRIYEINEDGAYHSHLLESFKTDLDIEEVVFKSICEENSEDNRDKVRIDITKELPIRVMIAFEKDRTRIRLFLHAMVGDIIGITRLFREIGDILKCYLQKMSLPEKNAIMNPADAVRGSLMPRMNELRTYWSSTMKEKDVQPFTFFSDLGSDLDENCWKNCSRMVPASLVERMMNFINSQGLSLYNFIMSVYMVLLHERTGRKVIPLVTYADMRSHISQFQSVLHSCSNAVPVVCDLRNMGTVATFLKTNSDKLNEITQHSAYPYELIQDEMESEELKLHIGRHRFIMENMTSLRNQFRHDGVEIKIGNIYYKRHVYETSLHIEYDTIQNVIILQFGYNDKALTTEDAKNILERMHHLIYKFLRAPHEDIVSILQEENNITEQSDLEKNASLTHDSTSNSTKDRQSTDYEMETDLDLGRNEEYQEIKQTVILTETFLKQTTQGWEHSVHLKLSKKVFERRNSGEILISWGSGKKQRTINGHDILEVEVKKINHTFYVLIKTRARLFVFKAPSSSKAMGWLNTFKQVHCEIKDLNRQEMVYHL